jgi:hypothetical protein
VERRYDMEGNLVVLVNSIKREVLWGGVQILWLFRGLYWPEYHQLKHNFNLLNVERTDDC